MSVDKFHDELNDENNVTMMFNLLINIYETGIIPEFDPNHKRYKNTSIKRHTDYYKLIAFIHFRQFVRLTENGYKLNGRLSQIMNNMRRLA